MKEFSLISECTDRISSIMMWSRRLSYFVIASLLFIPIVNGFSALADTPKYEAPVDITEAKQLCDEGSLQPVEGIWNFPDDNMTVMVRQTRDYSGNVSSPRYAVTILYTPDVRLLPGETIGWIDASPDPGKFRLTLFTRKQLSTLLQPANLLAELSNDGASLKVKAEKWSLKLSRITFLSSFFRSIKLHHDNPLKQLPVGLTKVYPLSDRLPASSNSVRYL